MYFQHGFNPGATQFICKLQQAKVGSRSMKTAAMTLNCYLDSVSDVRGYAVKLENITNRGLRIHSDGRINLTNAIIAEHGDNPQAWLINPETNVIEEWHGNNTITQPTADECDALRTKGQTSLS